MDDCLKSTSPGFGSPGTRLSLGWLTFPVATWIALLIGVVVSVPTLYEGLLLDDYHHLNRAAAAHSTSQALDLFRFLPGTGDTTEQAVRGGPFPWWTNPALKHAFWRPLSSALIRADVLAFGRSIWLHHLHSAIWFLVVIAAVSSLLRRTLPGTIGAATLLLFAIDDVHWMPVSWLAQRNTLVAAAPAFFALAAHVEWRERGWWPGLPLSLIGLAIGLAGGESALGVACLVMAYQIFADPRPVRARVLGLVPMALLCAFYVGLYEARGYGTRGSGVYLDPFTSTGAFLTALPERLMAMVAALLAAVPADFHPRRFQIVGGSMAALLAAVMLRRAWTGLDHAERRHVRWILIGASWSLVLLATTLPHDRILLVPSVGASVLVAVLLRHGWRSSYRFDRAIAYGLLILHVPLALYGWVHRHGVFLRAGPRAEEVVLAPDLPMGDRRVVLLVAPDLGMTLYGPSMRQFEGAPPARSWWILSAAPYDHRLTRTAPETIELEVVGGRLLTTPLERLFRSPQPALGTGTRVRLDGCVVRVLDADALGATRVAFRFAVPLDDPSLLVLEWRDGRLQPAELPPIGASRLLRYAPGPLRPLGF